MENDMTEMNPPIIASEPAKPSSGALVLFLLLEQSLPACLLIYHLVLWFTEQTAVMSGSQASLEWAGLIGLAVQAVIMTGIAGGLWRFTNDLRFKPVFRGWFFAALMAFPALLLRLLGPNNDQLGSILQILICVIAAVIVARVQGTKLDWRSSNISFAFLLAAFGIGPLT